MQKQNIAVCDKILKYFYEHRSENVIVHNIWKQYSNSEKEFYTLIIDLESDGLIYKSSTKQYTNPAMNMYRITPEGSKICESGGLEVVHKASQDSIEKKRITEEMEYQKLSAELIDLRNRIKDYNKVKLQAIISLLIAGISLLVAIIALFKE